MASLLPTAPHLSVPPENKCNAREHEQRAGRLERPDRSLRKIATRRPGTIRTPSTGAPAPSTSGRRMCSRRLTSRTRAPNARTGRRQRFLSGARSTMTRTAIGRWTCQGTRVHNVGELLAATTTIATSTTSARTEARIEEVDRLPDLDLGISARLGCSPPSPLARVPRVYRCIATASTPPSTRVTSCRSAGQQAMG